MPDVHTLSLRHEKDTFHGSHYSTDSSVTFVVCSCGFEGRVRGSGYRSQDDVAFRHKVEVLLKKLDIVFESTTDWLTV